MKEKLEALFNNIKNLCESEVERIIGFVASILSDNQQSSEKPECPHCGSGITIKYGHRNGKPRFLCHGCGRTFMRTTNSVMSHSHYGRSVWHDFIRDTLYGMTLDHSAEELGFSHQTAFNMRHKVLIALQDLISESPVVLSRLVELDETYVLECRKGAKLPKEVKREPRKHGAKASSPGISDEYIAICTAVQRDGGAVAMAVNRAKPSKEELEKIYSGHFEAGTVALTDGLRSYSVLRKQFHCLVVDVNHEEDKSFFNLSIVNNMHSYIKEAYVRYRGVATKYINRYNAMFSLAFRNIKDQADDVFSSLCQMGRTCLWHRVKEIKVHNLACI